MPLFQPMGFQKTFKLTVLQNHCGIIYREAFTDSASQHQLCVNVLSPQASQTCGFHLTIWSGSPSALLFDTGRCSGPENFFSLYLAPTTIIKTGSFKVKSFTR